MSKAKRNALLGLAVAAVLVALLATSVQTITLSPGEPFAIEQQANSIGVSNVDSSNLFGWLMRGVIAVTLVLLPVYIIYSLMSKQGRRRLLTNVIMLAVFLLIADQLRERMSQMESEGEQQGVLSPQSLEGGEAIPVSTFPAEPPAWLTVAVILGGALVLVTLAAIALYLYRNRYQPKAIPQYEALAEAAQQTITAIQTGGDLKASVIACYREMSRVVQEQRGIARETTMTPREFEDVLIHRGLPGDAVKTLTRLFESVRYGSAADGAQETEQAIACLTEIADYCNSFGSTRANADAGTAVYAGR
jgi:hypothetical protein